MLRDTCKLVPVSLGCLPVLLLPLLIALHLCPVINHRHSPGSPLSEPSTPWGNLSIPALLRLDVPSSLPETFILLYAQPQLSFTLNHVLLSIDR